VLSLDADYLLSNEFVALLERDETEFEFDGYYASFRYCVFGRALRASLYPPRIILFRRDRGRYVADGHTQLLQLDGRAEHLKATVFHDDRKPIAAWLAAQQRYTELEVEKLKGPREQLSRIDKLRLAGWLVPLITPFYCLFVRGLILDGYAGWFYAFQRTYAEMLLALRILDRPNGVSRRHEQINA
jgi:hypothetical protein